MEKLLWVACVLCLGAVLVDGASHSYSHAPSPAVDCSSVLLRMADCLTFVMNGSTISKPEGTCCSGFKSVLKEVPSCLCEAFKNNNNLGIALNMTKAMTIPSACGVSTPPLSKCGLSAVGAPAPVPSLSPSAAPQQSAPSNSSATSAEATAPTPSQSVGAAIFSSVELLVFGLAVAAVSSF